MKRKRKIFPFIFWGGGIVCDYYNVVDETNIIPKHSHSWYNISVKSHVVCFRWAQPPVPELPLPDPRPRSPIPRQIPPAKCQVNLRTHIHSVSHSLTFSFTHSCTQSCSFKCSNKWKTKRRSLRAEYICI